MTGKTKPIHAFTAGTHTTRLGAAVTITDTDLQAAADAYNPELHEAPLVIGHPEGTAPAYGWIEACHVNGSDFFITPTQVNPDFAELHNAGAFKKRSMSFYHPDNKLNPKPGVWYPRHLGFLGAQPPAIKGLADYNFEEGDGDTLTVEFGEWEDRVEASMFRSLREWILAKFGADDANQALPGWDVKAVEDAAARPDIKEDDGIFPAFSEHQSQENTMTPEQIAAQEALNQQKAEQATRDAEFSEREQKLAEREQATHKADCADFIEALVNEGKVLPAQKDNLIDFMAALEQTDTVEFSEGEDKKVSMTPLQFMQAYLTAQPKVVEFGEHQAGEAAGDIDVKDSAALARAAADFVEAESAKGRTVTVTDAVNHIITTNGGTTNE